MSTNIATAQVCAESQGPGYTSFDILEPVSQAELDAELTRKRVRTFVGLTAIITGATVLGLGALDAYEQRQERPAVVYQQDAFGNDALQPMPLPSHFRLPLSR